MSGIARILLARGLAVSGCDAKDSTRAGPAAGARRHGRDRARPGARRRRRHRGRLQRDPADQPRARGGPGAGPARAAAGRRARLGDGRPGTALAIAGTHGKTTTTSMLTVAMHACGRDPSYAIGGDLNEPGSNAHNGSGEFFVAEADESDRSFLLLSPHGAVDHQRRARPPRQLRRRRRRSTRPSRASSTGSSRRRRAARRRRPGLDARCCRSPGSAGCGRCTFGRQPRTPTSGSTGSTLAGSGSAFDLVAEGRRLGRVDAAGARRLQRGERRRRTGPRARGRPAVRRHGAGLAGLRRGRAGASS